MMNRLLIYLAIGAGVVAMAINIRYLNNKNAQLENNSAMLVAEINRQQQVESINQAVMSDLTNQLKDNQKHGESIEHEIQKYKNDLGNCERVNANFVRIHNRSAKVQTTKASSESNGVNAAALLTVINKNYELYHNCVAVVNGWQEWYLQQSALYEHKDE